MRPSSGYGSGRSSTKHALDNREHRRGGADAECQRQDGGHGEGRLLPQHARRVSQVLPYIAGRVSSRSARHDGRRHLRLVQWRHALRQQVPLPEPGERQTGGIVLSQAPMLPGRYKANGRITGGSHDNR